jgi:putative prolin-rich transmembrane protein
MEITYPISSSRFLLAMQVYARKMASYETYEEVKKREFERISLFRPLPTVLRESIKTEVVEESPRYLLDTEGSEDETVELESLFEGFDSIQDSDWLTSMKSKEEVERRDEEEEQDPLQGVSFASLGLGSGSSDDEQELELREFEVDPSEDEDEFSDLLSNSPKSSLNNLGSEVDKLSTSEEKSNLSQSETSESNLESEPTRVEFKEEIFRSDYVGKREPWTYVAKEKEVVKPPQTQLRVSTPEVAPRQVQEPKPTPRPQVVSAPQPKPVVRPKQVAERPQIQPQPQVQVQDKTVRMVNEDFVSYCRRNLRVQEQVALGYFSPSEIESAVRQGKVLRKGGVLIFAHS